MGRGLVPLCRRKAGEPPAWFIVCSTSPHWMEFWCIHLHTQKHRPFVLQFLCATKRKCVMSTHKWCARGSPNTEGPRSGTDFGNDCRPPPALYATGNDPSPLSSISTHRNPQFFSSSILRTYFREFTTAQFPDARGAGFKSLSVDFVKVLNRWPALWRVDPRCWEERVAVLRDMGVVQGLTEGRGPRGSGV